MKKLKSGINLSIIAFSVVSLILLSSSGCGARLKAMDSFSNPEEELLILNESNYDNNTTLNLYSTNESTEATTTGSSITDNSDTVNYTCKNRITSSISSSTTIITKDRIENSLNTTNTNNTEQDIPTTTTTTASYITSSFMKISSSKVIILYTKYIFDANNNKKIITDWIKSFDLSSSNFKDNDYIRNSLIDIGVPSDIAPFIVNIMKDQPQIDSNNIRREYEIQGISNDFFNIHCKYYEVHANYTSFIKETYENYYKKDSGSLETIKQTYPNSYYELIRYMWTSKN